MGDAICFLHFQFFFVAKENFYFLTIFQKVRNLPKNNQLVKYIYSKPSLQPLNYLFVIRQYQSLLMDHPITLEEQRKVWTIHKSVNGTTYYYNRATKKSQYEMPECFKTTEEVLQHPDWKEYRTAQGKRFYYNAITRKSEWQLPNQVKEYRIKLEQKRKKDREQGKIQEQQVLSEAEVIKRKFMKLLKQKLIGVNTKWDACIKLCEDDERWSLLKISDKKRYYLEYISELKKVSDKEKKAKNEVNKSAFLKMLKENKSLNSDCKMHKIAYDFLTDPRWRLLEEHERENAYQGYMDELAQKEREDKQKARKQNTEAFRQTLQRENVKYNTRWDDIRHHYKDDLNFKGLHPYDRISTFLEYIFDAEKKWEEEQVKQKRLKERVNRINFRELLRSKIACGEVAYKTKWRQFLTDYRHQKAILNMLDPNQPGTSAHQIFQHFMEEVREKQKVIKGLIKHYFKRQGFKMTETTQKCEFFQKLSSMTEFIELPEQIRSYFYFYFLMKIRSKKQTKQTSAKKTSRKERKVIFRIFESLQVKGLLKNKYSIEGQMDYVEKSMRDSGYTVTSEAIFKYYLAFLESVEEQSRRRSRSEDSYSSGVKKDRKSKKEGLKEQKEKQVSLKKFDIPNLKELRGQNEEGEEEGQIKDDSEEIKKKPKSKKRKRSSSSDSD